jgi:hypothetical protein
MTKKKTPAQKGHDKVRPDHGQGSEGNFGTDGDWNTDSEDLKKAQRESSLVTIKKGK